MISVFHIVELEGVEPSSKQGTKVLSTCLSSPRFSCTDKTEATNQCLISLNFIITAEPATTILDLAAPPYPQPRGDGLGETSRSCTLYWNKDSLLYFDYAARA